MEGKGLITVETGASTLRRRTAEGSARLVRIAVLDEGPGPGEGLPLFTPFATTKATGTGLGLVVARRIVEAHRGRLELRRRRDGHGAEAELLLPLPDER
jgi:two-component system nitrogen regulation sensor histidine kinase GlnL